MVPVTTNIMNSNTPSMAPTGVHSNQPVAPAADIEMGNGKLPKDEKLPLSSSFENARLEWKHGSKTRVVKYYAIYVALVICIGCAIGLVIVLI
ncbi:hypothetical protein CC86DRAFT_41229 [Ophiobolus disseminans]|uniref:Uncharacterized protein n=1 Tax=Ophiobolus disseminans TaxID=1469910 RepID=A0A6A6ZX46_9PLEO|nr:hypothetical protein CC86DRAFT_41229 [Ophiobolus disseminans]